MQTERENLYKVLTFVDFDVAGNSLRAYYDADNKLVFVLDFVENETKPNVLLVINPVGNRKWDDILMNDYGVDLETVRPKKDNKYQKLDIEYSGLAEYDDLLQAYVSGDDVEEPLKKLNAFRNVAAMRAATERRDDAEITVEKARETIIKTQEKIDELQLKLKKLRSKLSLQRANIGKEPTKQSAAKILRIEAQIDSTTEKINRAKKRLDKAQKRLGTAQDEIDEANLILKKLDGVALEYSSLPMAPIPTDVTVLAEEKVPATLKEDFWDENNDDSEPKVDYMAENDVKPLFDKDPNILDESGAFKSVDFSVGATDNVPVVKSGVEPEVIETEDFHETDAINIPQNFFDSKEIEQSEEFFDEKDAVGVSKVYDENVSFKPLELEDDKTEEFPLVQQPNFIPEPVEPEFYEETDFVDMPNAQEVPETKGNESLSMSGAPVFDAFEKQDVGENNMSENLDSELLGGFAPLEIPKIADESVPLAKYEEAETIEEPVYQPIMPQPIVTEEYDEEQNVDSGVAMPEISPAPISSDFRPVSPMVMNTDNNVVEVVDEAKKSGKPTLVYYVLLVLLIVLSVFTLWYYQKIAGDATPVLTAQTQTVEEDMAVPENVDKDAFVVSSQAEIVPVEVEAVDEPVDALVEKDIVFDDTVEPEVISVTEPEPIVFEPEVKPVVVEPVQESVEEDNVVEEPKSPFLSDQEVRLIKIEEEILKEKPVYAVASETEVFVEQLDAQTEQGQQEESLDVVEQKPEIEFEVPVIEYKEPVVQQVTSEEYLDDSMGGYADSVYEPSAAVFVESVDYEDAPLQQTASEMIVETEIEEVCADGSLPDLNGCCNGEESVLIDGEPMCCIIGGDECFPPM